MQQRVSTPHPFMNSTDADLWRRHYLSVTLPVCFSCFTGHLLKQAHTFEITTLHLTGYCISRVITCDVSLRGLDNILYRPAFLYE